MPEEHSNAAGGAPASTTLAKVGEDLLDIEDALTRARDFFTVARMAVADVHEKEKRNALARSLDEGLDAIEEAEAALFKTRFAAQFCSEHIKPERQPATVDLMDEGLACISACALALQAGGGLLDAGALESITYTLNTGIATLGRARSAINKAHAEGGSLFVGGKAVRS